MPEWADELSITVMSRGVSEQIMPQNALQLEPPFQPICSYKIQKVMDEEK